MSTPHLIMWAVVFAVALLARRNATAIALIASWMIGETAWLITGNNLPLSAYFMADLAVISVIYAKMIRRVGAKQYSTLWLQCKCMFLDLAICDRWIVAIFLLGAWPLYVANIHPYYQWWALWALTISQFLLAGAEAAFQLHREYREQAEEEPPGLALAGAFRDYG
jgi:hypothetical protein